MRSGTQVSEGSGRLLVVATGTQVRTSWFSAHALQAAQQALQEQFRSRLCQQLANQGEFWIDLLQSGMIHRVCLTQQQLNIQHWA